MDCVHCRGTGGQPVLNSILTELCYECDGTGVDPDTETVKSVMFSRMRSFLEFYTSLDGEFLDDALDKVMKIAFDTCKISEEEQYEEWRD